jgi:hypothetical protein
MSTHGVVGLTSTQQATDGRGGYDADFKDGIGRHESPGSNGDSRQAGESGRNGEGAWEAFSVRGSGSATPRLEPDQAWLAVDLLRRVAEWEVPTLRQVLQEAERWHYEHLDRS